MEIMERIDEILGFIVAPVSVAALGKLAEGFEIAAGFDHVAIIESGEMNGLEGFVVRSIRVERNKKHELKPGKSDR